MQIILLISSLVFGTTGLFAQGNDVLINSSDQLWYRQPAAVWTEVLPVGNVWLGAMSLRVYHWLVTTR